MKLIIFDIDGVLEKEEKIIEERRKALLNFLMEKYSISKQEAEKRKENAKKHLPSEKKNTTVEVYIKAGLKRQEYFDTLNKIDPKGLIEGHKNCKKTLKKLNKETLVAYSNAPQYVSIRTLKILGIEKKLNKVFSAEEFRESKPSKANLKKILSEMDFEPKNTVMVGNNPVKDLLPAKELGMTTILFSQNTKREKNSDYVVDDLIQIPEIINE